MEGFKITSIIQVIFSDILLEMHFNIEKSNKKSSFCISITDDGEILQYNEKNTETLLNDIEYQIYGSVALLIEEEENDDLGRLINAEIQNVQFGIGYELITNEKVLYYFKITSDKNEFLLFNNGDNGAYSFDQIKNILARDIYGYEWNDVF